MEKAIVEICGEKAEVTKGTTLAELSKEYADRVKYDIILAKVDGRLRELYHVIDHDCSIEFITTGDKDGIKTYIRGMIFVLVKSVYDVIRKENIERFVVEFSLKGGYYCEYKGSIKLTKEVLYRIEDRMREIVDADMPFVKKTVDTDEAIKLFYEHGMYDKSRLFKYRRCSKTNIYMLGNFEDYYYGYMPVSTGILRHFKLHLFDEGLILQMPEQNNPEILTEYEAPFKFYETLKESNLWGRAVNVDTVGALNDVISSGGIGDLILVQEALQEKKIAQIAGMIAADREKKFVMIAGPSSSGKTTFSHRLSIQLMTYGLHPRPIAVDNYFVNREDTPLDEEGNYNFEILEAMDVELFNRDMTALLRGERVEIPNFNFKTGHREYKGDFMQLGKDDILVIEGIHCLNDRFSYSLPKESKFKIYISALTQLNVDEHNRIPTTDGRLIRRIVRDFYSRGTKAKDTIKMWPSVRKGENENIFPFQHEADVMFNSALIYELAVLKQYVEPMLFGIDKECPEYTEAKRLLKFLDYFIGVSDKDIPKNSMLREFIGGSCFDVR